MSQRNKTNEWLREFDAFLRVQDSNPLRATDERIRRVIKAELEPSLKLVLTKVFALHAIAVGLVTIVCPQLGVGPLIGGDGLMHFFMAFGRLPCAAFCGGLLFAVSGSLVSFVLRREELRLANRYRFLSVTLLASVSFAGLMLAGGESDQMSYAFWILGAILAGWLSLRFGLSVRLRSTKSALG